GLEETEKASALTLKEIFHILNHKAMQLDDNKGLMQQVFFWLSLLCGLCGDNAERIAFNNIFRYNDDRLYLIFNYKKIINANIKTEQIWKKF
ncbi:2137_t:CDS:1, partial [Racocetra fulgida]